MMEIEKIIEICKDRNELEFLFKLTKQIAESDSICEGYGYCREYTKENFNNAEKHIESEEYKKRGFNDEYDLYLECGGVPIYELYLDQIKNFTEVNI